MKRLLTLLLCLALLASFTLLFASCTAPDNGGSTDNGGSNGEGDGGDTGTDDGTTLALTKGGEAKFTLVFSPAASKTLKDGVNAFQKYFTDAGITVSKVGSNEVKKIQDCEILIGSDIEGRDDYVIDPHTVGTEGYAIRVKGSKITVNGGCDRTTVTALLELAKLLKLGEEGTDISNLSIERTASVTVKQDYPVKNITVGGVNIDYHVIAIDKTHQGSVTVANELQKNVYNMSGFWLPIVGYDEIAGDAICISVVENAGAGGFRAYVEGSYMYVECALEALMVEAGLPFVAECFPEGNESDLHFDYDFSYTDDILTVSYADYGAVGDGVTDDYDAIFDTHRRANATGQTVVAEMGKRYYIGAHYNPIVIRTNTIWTGAVIIIDDSEVDPSDPIHGRWAFTVVGDGVDYTIPEITLSSLKKGQKNIGITLPEPMLLKIVNSNVKQYIRYGNNANDGSDMQEVILVDENGNVDPSTPIMWNYSTVTSVTAIPISDKPITITGGTLLTIANQAPSAYTYYNRGIAITRSNVTVKNVNHNITGEGPTGAPYNGFFTVNGANNVLLEGLVLTGHKVYKLETNTSTSMGTYELSCSHANNVTYKNVTQTNDINDTAYWGVMGTNHSKNLTYDGCRLSRFDAHQGVYNATIINSELGHQKIQAIGAGTLRIENTTVHGNTVVSLRGDYGSTWDGDVIIKNVTVINTGDVTLISGSFTNHYFGYVCHLPTNVYIDGVTLDRSATVAVFANFTTGMNSDKVNGAQNKNPVAMPKYVEAANVKYNLVISKNKDLFGYLTITKK